MKGEGLIPYRSVRGSHVRPIPRSLSSNPPPQSPSTHSELLLTLLTQSRLLYTFLIYRQSRLFLKPKPERVLASINWCHQGERRPAANQVHGSRNKKLIRVERATIARGGEMETEGACKGDAISSNHDQNTSTYYQPSLPPLGPARFLRLPLVSRFLRAPLQQPVCLLLRQ